MTLPATLQTALDQFQLPEPLGFGSVTGPALFVADYRNGRWQEGELMRYEPIALNPAATALQFGQQCFEGMKAFWVEQDRPALFRPDQNHQRMQRSAERLCMPVVPEDLFWHGVREVTLAMQNFIPRESGHSLYLRPMLYGCDTQYPLASSDNFRFAIVCSPSAAYFAQPIKVLVEREACRAAVGGTGDVKAGGNYAGSILVTKRCVERGFHQPLWLDPVHHQTLEELSAMNVCAIINGEFHTPALNGTILPGITRDSLLTLARDMGMTAVERPIPVDELLDDIDAGRCSEMFACGTAAIVNPIALVGDGDRRAELRETGVVAEQLKQALLGIQDGKDADPRQWMRSV